MKKKENSGTANAEAENMETMELLTGMLDNATRCGDAPEKECTEETPEQGNDANRPPANREHR